MDDPAVVRGFERVGDLARDRQRLRNRQRPARDEHREVVAVHQLHHQRAWSPGRAVPFEPVDVRDVGMVQRGERLRFAGEAGEAFVVRCKELGEHFDRDLTIELRVAGAIDLAHATGPERRHDFIGPESGAD